MQNGHGVYDCCEICGKHIRYDGYANETGVYHRKCVKVAQVHYTCEYDLVSETKPLIHVRDNVTVDYALSESELAVHLSLHWALVRGETNDLTNLIIVRRSE